MSEVDIDTIAAKNESELVDQTLSRSFNSENLMNFKTVIGDGLACVNLWIGQDLLECNSISLDDPVVISLLELASVLVVLAVKMLCESDF